MATLAQYEDHASHDDRTLNAGCPFCWPKPKSSWPRNAKPCTEILTRDPLTGRARTARGYIRAGSKRLAEGVVWAGEDCCELALDDAEYLLAEKGRAA